MHRKKEVQRYFEQKYIFPIHCILKPSTMQNHTPTKASIWQCQVSVLKWMMFLFVTACWITAAPGGVSRSQSHLCVGST